MNSESLHSPRTTVLIGMYQNGNRYKFPSNVSSFQRHMKEENSANKITR